MGLDPTKIVYQLFLVTNGSDGSGKPSTGTMPLNFTALQWEEQPDELAVRLTATVPNYQTPAGWVHQLAALAAPVVLYADWGSGATEVFRGKIWTWEFSDDGKETVVLTCYDDLMYLQSSEDDRGYYGNPETGEGLSAATVLADIAQAWGITINGLGTLPSTPLPRLVYAGEKVSAMILDVLDQLYYRSGTSWLVRAMAGQISVVQPGSNTPVYVLSQATTTGYTDQQDMTQLVTEVYVLGLEADAGLGFAAPPAPVSPPAEMTQLIEGDTQYGRMRAIVRDPGPLSPVPVGELAQRLLADRGEPARVQRFTAPDLPFLRRGDAVYVQTGTLNKVCYVDGVQHDADAMTMQLEINTSGQAAHLNEGANISLAAAWLKKNGWGS